MTMTSSLIPSVMKKIVVQSLSNNFREAIEIKSVAIPHIKPHEALVRNHYVGINASDINFTAGKYMPGTNPPFDAGFEAVGQVVAIGDQLPSSLIGQSVAHMTNGAFSEYQAVSRLFPINDIKPQYIPCLVSAMTAKLALDSCAFLKPNEKVLITAAAGGTGQFAIQLAKLAGCHVIGTCSSEEKLNFLKQIGCDHPINTSSQNLDKVLKDSYPGGVDVVYESVGGETYEICVNRLAPRGRLIVIGYISGYKEPMGVASTKFARSAAALPIKLLMKSASVHGFFLFHFASKWKETFQQVSHLYHKNQLVSTIDLGKSVKVDGFHGLEEIPDAVDYLYSKKSIGKVVVDLTANLRKSKL